MRLSQLPFGWVCFSNGANVHAQDDRALRLNCLSAGSVSLTNGRRVFHLRWRVARRLNCLSAGSVSLTRSSQITIPINSRSQLPFGWVCFSNVYPGCELAGNIETSQLPFGWVCFSNRHGSGRFGGRSGRVSIAFRLGLFL